MTIFDLSKRETNPPAENTTSMFTPTSSIHSLSGVVSFSVEKAAATLGFNSFEEMDDMFVQAYDFFSLDDDRRKPLRVRGFGGGQHIVVDMSVTPDQIRHTFATPVSEPLIKAIQEVQRERVYRIVNAFGDDARRVIEKEKTTGWIDYDQAIVSAKNRHEVEAKNIEAAQRALRVSDATDFSID